MKNDKKIGIDKRDIKQVLDFMHSRTGIDKVKYAIDIFNKCGSINHFIEIISNGNNMVWLVNRARDEKMNFYFFMEQVLINKYDELKEKLGE